MLLIFLLYVLQDCSHLVVHGETVDSILLHNDWLHENAHCKDEEMLRSRLLATAQDRHERLKSMMLAEALLLYPFLATEVSVCLHLFLHAICSNSCAFHFHLLVEFETLFKRAAADCIQDGCNKMGSIILNRGSSDEVATVSEVATGNSTDCYCLCFRSVGKRPVATLGDSHYCRCTLCQF